MTYALTAGARIDRLLTVVERALGEGRFRDDLPKERLAAHLHHQLFRGDATAMAIDVEPGETSLLRELLFDLEDGSTGLEAAAVRRIRERIERA